MLGIDIHVLSLISCIFCGLTSSISGFTDYYLGVDDVIRLQSRPEAASGEDFLLGITSEEVRHRALLSVAGVSDLREAFARAAQAQRCLRVVNATLELRVTRRTAPAFEQRDSLVRTSARARTNVSRDHFLFRVCASQVKKRWTDDVTDVAAAARRAHLWSAPPMLDTNGRDAHSPVACNYLSSGEGDVTVRIDVRQAMWRWLAGVEENNGLLVWLWQDALLAKVQWDGLKSGAVLQVASVRVRATTEGEAVAFLFRARFVPRPHKPRVLRFNCLSLGRSYLRGEYQILTSLLCAGRSQCRWFCLCRCACNVRSRPCY